jgi:trehalose-phosphatase
MEPVTRESGLAERLEEIVHAPLLLVAVDFDGTIAPIAPHPDQAAAHPAALAALTALARLPQTRVAIVSGRPLLELERLVPAADVDRVGCHGAEVAGDRALVLPEERRLSLAKAQELGSAAAARLAGSHVEVKPAGVTFHWRGCDPAAAAPLVEQLRGELARLPGVRVLDGKAIVEAIVAGTDKGRALERLRHRAGATHVLYLGDDVTDDDAFKTLRGGDLGVAVGDGERATRHRVEDTIAASVLLAQVRSRRADWLARAERLFPPIERHVLLSDQRALALLDPRGRISWACLPRLDSSALFAELVGGPDRGYFEVRPADDSEPTAQRYRGDSLIVETEWPGLRVVDYLDTSGGRAFQRAGRSDLLRVVEGRGAVRISFAPCVGYGRAATRLVAARDGLVVEGVREECVLRAPGVRFEIRESGHHSIAEAVVELGAQPLALELRYGTRALGPAPEPEATRRERTAQHWSAWARTLTLPATARDLVLRSALTLRALTYGPTGAIAAAATTSLPEQLGGTRNWDYRLCWPRDASLAAAALAELGALGPGIKLLDWMLGLFDRLDPGALLAPVYTVAGNSVAPEAELSDLSGYRGSRPVRVGNLASEQVQLDVFGPIVELMALLSDRGAPLSWDHWRMLETLMGALQGRWHEPDAGIWEIRGPLRHHVHTKAMSWQAADRACRVASYLGRECGEWQRLRDAIAADLLANGPRASDQSFGAAYGGEQADASALFVGLSGLLPPDDPRFVATVERVERELLEGNVVRRYSYDDGLAGSDGGFHYCTTWLVRAWLLRGKVDEARRLFDAYCATAGPTGLLAEEHDGRRGVALGNFPQAYSHAGLIEAALAIERFKTRS